MVVSFEDKVVQDHAGRRRHRGFNDRLGDGCGVYLGLSRYMRILKRLVVVVVVVVIMIARRFRASHMSEVR